MKNEPLLSVGAIVTLVTAVITLLVQFGIPISDGQADAITGLVIGAWPVVIVLWARSKVVSPATDAERSKQAYLDGVLGKEPSVPVE